MSRVGRDDPAKVSATPVYAGDARGVVAANAMGKDDLLPIGEGAYVSAEAVAQRTKDSSRACEDGRWSHCFGKDKSDLLDGHSYGNMEEPAPPTTTMAATTTEGS